LCNIGLRKRMINTEDLLNLINKAVYEQVRMPVADAVNELLKSKVNLENIIESSVINAFKNELNQKIGNINVNELVDQKVNELFDDYIKNTTGISIDTENTELSIIDEAVVVENELISKNVKVINDLEVGNDLTVNGVLNIPDNLKDNIINSVIEQFQNKAVDIVSEKVVNTVKSQSIDFNNITLSGKKILTEDKLQDINKLDKLSVNGESDFNGTFYVRNKRVGINTEVPAMGLSVWEEEVNVLAGKLKEKTGFIGTANQQKLSIGVNRREDITVDEDGLVKVGKLQIGQNRIKYETDLPGYKGTKGDITFNTNVSQDNPVFAWVCLSGHNWLPLKAIV